MDKCPRCSCKEKIGIEIRGGYDGVLFWRCLACNLDYHRWEDEWMRKKAERHMNPRDGGEGSPVPA